MSLIDKQTELVLEQIKLIDDEHLLAENYKNHSHWLVRLNTLEKLTDEDLIWNCFSQDTESYIVSTVVSKINNDERLATLSTHKSWLVRADAVLKMKDENLIFKSFGQDSEDYVLSLVIKKVSDERLLVETYKNNYVLRLDLLEKLTNQDLIWETFHKHDCPEVICSLINKIDNENLLFETYKDYPNRNILIALVRKLTDQKLIYENFKDKGVEVLLEFIKKIDNNSLLDELCKENEKSFRILKAIKRRKYQINKK